MKHAILERSTQIVIEMAVVVQLLESLSKMSGPGHPEEVAIDKFDLVAHAKLLLACKDISEVLIETLRGPAFDRGFNNALRRRG